MNYLNLNFDNTDAVEILQSVIDSVELIVVDFGIVNFYFSKFPTNPKSHGQVVGVANRHPEHVPAEVDAALFHLFIQIF